MLSGVFLYVKLFELLLFYTDAVLGNNCKALNSFNREKSSSVACLPKGSERFEDDIVFSAELSHLNKINADVLLYRYFIKHDDRSLLAYPNELDSIRFNQQFCMTFDDDLELPSAPANSFSIYTCKHNVPLLIRINGPYGFILYSMNSGSGMWENYRVAKLSEYENLDRNGIVCYKHSSFTEYKQINNEIESQCQAIAECVCKDHKFMEAKVITNPPLEIAVRSFNQSSTGRESPEPLKNNVSIKPIKHSGQDPEVLESAQSSSESLKNNVSIKPIKHSTLSQENQESKGVSILKRLKIKGSGKGRKTRSNSI